MPPFSAAISNAVSVGSPVADHVPFSVRLPRLRDCFSCGLWISAVLQRLPVSLSELREMIGSLLAVGVGLEQAALVDNSFCYCAAGEEQSAAYDGTGYGESGAGLGGAILMEE